MKILNEDRVVKFNGKIDPLFGWCIIVVGGPGSGKSKAFKEKILIQSKKYDPDELKIFRKHDSDFDGEYYLLKSGQKFRPAQMGIEPPYDLSNKKVTAALHEITRPIRNSIKNHMLSDSGHDSNRLPNISFDITGSDVEDITSIVYTAKNIGYKIAIVWVITELSVAFDRRVNKAKRRMEPEVVVEKHRGVHDTLNSLLANGVVEQVNDFWILLDTISIRNIEGQNYEDILSQEVFKSNDKEIVRVSNVFRVGSTAELSNFDDLVISEIEKDPRLFKYLTAFHSIEAKTREQITDYYKSLGMKNDDENLRTEK